MLQPLHAVLTSKTTTARSLLDFFAGEPPRSSANCFAIRLLGKQKNTSDFEKVMASKSVFLDVFGYYPISLRYKQYNEIGSQT